MAYAARSAHRSMLPPAAARGAVASLLALGLALAPCRVLAHTADASRAPGDEPTPSGTPEVDEPAADATAGEEAAASDQDDVESNEPSPTEADEPEPEPEQNEQNEQNELDGDDAEDELDDDDELAETPPPQGEALRPLQTAAWWTMFGAFAVGTTAGVLAGLAERQEDRATRLSSLFDANTGAQPLYADRQDEYEGYLRRGDAYARAAIGVAVVAGLTTIASITLFAIDAKRQRSDRAPRTALRVRPGGLEVRF